LLGGPSAVDADDGEHGLFLAEVLGVPSDVKLNPPKLSLAKTWDLTVAFLGALGEITFPSNHIGFNAKQPRSRARRQ